MAMNTNMSSKFRTIIPKCEVIKEGSPSCFKLTTKTNTVGTLRRVTFGRRNVDRPNKTILLVGETGSGKSTLVNFLVNYCMGVKFEDDVWFSILEEEEKSQSESQTSDVIVYKIFGFEGQTLPYSLTIIDTPGYGSTKTIEHDVIVSQRLFDWFRVEDGVHEVDVVGLVMKATENRLSDRLSYVFDSVMSLFGKDLEKNIVALMTHSDGVIPTDALEALKDANIKCAKNEEGQPVHFLFNNRQDQDRSQQRQRQRVKDIHQISVEGMEGLVAFMEQTAPQKLDETVSVLKERIRLTASIQNLDDRIHMTELKQRELKQTEEALKKHEQEMKMNEEFTIEVDEAYKEKEATDGRMWGLFFFEGVVRCRHCKENCHYPGCTVAWKPEHCEVMKNDRCMVCSRKCLASAHVKDKWVYVKKTRKVKKTLTDMKQRYESNKAEAEKKTSLLEKLQQEIENLEKDKEKWLEEAYQHIERLELIALNVDSVSTYVHLDFLIEKMKNKGYTEKVQKLKEMAKQVNKHLQSGIQYAERMLKRLTKSEVEMRGTEV